MRIAVCDDEKNIRKKLVGMLDEIREICAVELEIEECNDGDVLFNGEYDLILLDIEMPKMNGLLVKERLEKTNTAIVFITSHKELMPDAFGKNVYGFVSKPIDEIKTKEKIQDVIKTMEKNNGKILLEDYQGVHMFFFRDILYIQSTQKYSTVYTTREKILCNYSLGEWERILPVDDFMRCHKQFLVGIHHIQKLKDMIVLDNEQQVPISRRKKMECKEKYTKFIIRNAR